MYHSITKNARKYYSISKEKSCNLMMVACQLPGIVSSNAPVNSVYTS